MASTETLKQRVSRTNKHMFVWTLAWLLSLALFAFGPKFLWDFAPTYSLLSLAINAFFGFKMIVANKRHIDSMDEMQQRIHYNAMAVSLGISMIFGAAYGLLQSAQLIEHTPNPSNILFVMAISYIISVFVGFKKYL